MANEVRLIDANAMREDWLQNGENEFIYDTNAVLDSIDAQPTVDAVEVVRGRWIHKGAWHIECSECKYILAHIGEAKNYCPNCGAKMDGGNEDG